MAGKLTLDSLADSPLLLAIDLESSISPAAIAAFAFRRYVRTCRAHMGPGAAGRAARLRAPDPLCEFLQAQAEHAIEKRHAPRQWLLSPHHATYLDG